MAEPLDVTSTTAPKTPAAPPPNTTTAASDAAANSADDAGKAASRGAAVRQGAKDATKKMGTAAANVMKKGAQAASSKVAAHGGAAVVARKVGMKFATKGIPVVGTVLLAGEVLDIFRNAEPIMHHQPAAGRTEFLPVSGNGHIDTPHGDSSSPESVDSMDAHIVEVNNTSFQFESLSACSYCDDGCGEGCNKVEAMPFILDPEAAVNAIEAWAEAVDTIYTTLSQYEGEMWADRLLEKYGPGGVAGIPELLERTEDVSGALKTAVMTSEEMGAMAYVALRQSIRSAREEMQQRAEDEASTWGWVGDMFTNSRGDGSMERLQAATNGVNEAAAKNDDAVAALNAALEAWVAIEGKADESTAPDQTIPTRPTRPMPAPLPIRDPGEPEDPAPIGGSPSVTPAPSTPPPVEDDGKSIFDEIKDKLGDTGSQNPFGDTGTPSMGSGGSPFGDTGGGSPMSGGSSPFDSMGGTSPLSSGEDPFAEDEKPEPLDEGEDPFEEDEDAEALEDEESPFEDAEGDGDTAEGEELPGDDELAPEDGEAPVTDAGIPSEQAAAVDPNSEAARTVDVGGGRQVVFPDAKTADMVRQLMAADPSAPTSVYMAADGAGFNLPPMGQDIGQMVPPSTLREGDLIMGDAGNGVYIGNGEVLMEDQSVKPLGEVSSFNGEHQGLFRLEQTDMEGQGGAPADAPAQQVSSDGSTSPVGGDTSTVAADASAPASADSTSVEGTPGVPDESTVDAADTADTAVFGGETTETTGMDPASAAF